MNSFPISTYHCIRLCATSWVTGKEEKYLSFGTISVLPSSDPSTPSRDNERGARSDEFVKSLAPRGKSFA